MTCHQFDVERLKVVLGVDDWFIEWGGGDAVDGAPGERVARTYGDGDVVSGGGELGSFIGGVVGEVALDFEHGEAG